MNLEKLRATAISPLDNEQLIFSIDTTDSSRLLTVKPREYLLLTNDRLIYISGTGNDQKTIMTTIHDVETVEIASNHPGYSSYLWAGLAGLISILLFSSIDNTSVKLAATAIVLLMGVYLVIDQITRPRKPTVVFRACNMEIRWECDSTNASNNIYELIKRLYEIKRLGIHSPTSPTKFAPR